MNKRKYIAAPYLVWMVIFTVIPLLLILFYAFITRAESGALILTDKYIKSALSGSSMSVLLLSMEYALITTVLCLLLAYPAALFLWQLKSRIGSIVNLLFMLPMWMNFLLRTYAWRAILDSNGPLNKLLQTLGLGSHRMLYTEGAVLFGLVYNFLPFMLLPIYTSFTKIDNSLVQAAEDLGANRWQTLLRVVFPLTKPGIITGITMVFMPAVSTFVISRLLGGSQTMMFGDLLENNFMLLKDWNTGSALAIVMMIMMLLSMALVRKSDDDLIPGGG
ncbi:MAG: ABC transporter permease [Clostridia bacterium]|nr:ABC transporter permease [Clostridia bacterium]MBQ5957352.1 ABC transporter permease [Clostridia bacterium]